jgi:hypothetical protein
VDYNGREYQTMTRRFVEVQWEQKGNDANNAGYDVLWDNGVHTLHDLIMQEKPLLREKILGALARGYCTKENKHKTMDVDLCTAQADAILELFKEQ